MGVNELEELVCYPRGIQGSTDFCRLSYQKPAELLISCANVSFGLLAPYNADESFRLTEIEVAACAGVVKCRRMADTMCRI
jgi:hypothetical protein